jgi:hypothetical protein
VLNARTTSGGVGAVYDWMSNTMMTSHHSPMLMAPPMTASATAVAGPRRVRASKAVTATGSPF